MANKKRNKKYNPMKGAAMAAKLGLRNLAVWHDQRREFTGVINYKSVSSEDITLSLSNAVINFKHKWQMLLLAIGEDAQGKKYFKVDPVQVKHEMFQADLAKYLNERHKAFIERSFNKNHLRNAAYIAVPTGEEADRITDEQIDRIVTFNGAW